MRFHINTEIVLYRIGQTKVSILLFVFYISRSKYKHYTFSFTFTVYPEMYLFPQKISSIEVLEFTAHWGDESWAVCSVEKRMESTA